MKFRYALITLLMLTCWSLPSMVGAQPYRYIDKHGISRYTNLLSEVPPEQREAALNPATGGTPDKEKAVKGTDTGDAANAKAGEGISDDGGSLSAALLNQLMDELKSEHGAIEVERQKLEKEANNLKTPEDIETYREKVIQFNQRSAEYEKKRQQLEKDVKRFQSKFNSGKEVEQSKPSETEQTATGDRASGKLGDIEAELRKEYTELGREREKIAKEGENLETEEERQAYREKVARFNQRASDYDRRYQEYQKTQKAEKLQRKLQVRREALEAPTPEQAERTAVIEKKNRNLADDLNKMDAELSKEEAEIQKGREALMTEGEKEKTLDELKAYRNKVAEFNKRIADYEKRRKLHKQQVDDYNAGITSQ